MARGVARGEIWLHTFALPDKRRPVLVLSRQDAIDVLDTVMVAPITSTRHGVPSEVEVGVEDGLKTACAVNLDHVHTVRKRDLRRFVTTLKPPRMAQVCRALAVATGCA
jgi:mRNA interferase MazF